MAPEATSVGREAEGSSDVVAAIDEIDGRSHLVIADIARDDAWIAVSEHEAVSVDEIR
ncbi:DUF7556 family protein [Natrinema salsiterrestre]|uniref:Uncharacterized protein n=1 Tax=Natrinema salsiterrestre TaxID=2950540 RepID=A0A9Q4KZ68_9EURY|nr:hypothetical protein [Natrinema salsiterrestre]MDF9744184.1 hypothetical protein [Natrinema salsiterrestre]